MSGQTVRIPSGQVRRTPETGGRTPPPSIGGVRPDPESKGRTERRLLDLHEAGTYVGVSYWTVRDLINSGELPSVRLPNPRRPGESVRRLLVDVHDLDSMIDKWKERT
jgi:predicted DNA-binding transcriptional regulator AlpA